MAYVKPRWKLEVRATAFPPHVWAELRSDSRRYAYVEKSDAEAEKKKLERIQPHIVLRRSPMKKTTKRPSLKERRKAFDAKHPDIAAKYKGHQKVANVGHTSDSYPFVLKTLYKLSWAAYQQMWVQQSGRWPLGTFARMRWSLARWSSTSRIGASPARQIGRW